MPSPEPGQVAEPGPSSDIPSPAETPGPSADPEPEPGSPATDLMPLAKVAREESDPLESRRRAKSKSTRLILVIRSIRNPSPKSTVSHPLPLARTCLRTLRRKTASRASPACWFVRNQARKTWPRSRPKPRPRLRPIPNPRGPGISGSLGLRVGLKPRSRWKLATGRTSGSGVSRLVRNVRSGQGRRGLTQLGSVVEFTPALSGVAESRPLRADSPGLPRAIAAGAIVSDLLCEAVSRTWRRSARR